MNNGAQDSYRILDTDKKVVAYINTIKQKGIQVLAVDTEGEFNLHRYGEHVCLIQMYDRSEFVIIDPLSVRPESIKSLFEDPRILKIMYDASGDRTLLYRQHGIEINAILDLQPAVELLKFPKRDLGSVLHSALDVEKKPKAKFQKYDWMRRPIDPNAIAYALDDVRYLFELKEVLMEKIFHGGMLDDYQLRNIEIQTRQIVVEPTPGVFKRERYRKLSADGKKLFTALYDLRDRFARKLDLPPNSVISNDELFIVSSNRMRIDEIRFSKQISGKMAAAIKEELLGLNL